MQNGPSFKSERVKCDQSHIVLNEEFSDVTKTITR